MFSGKSKQQSIHFEELLAEVKSNGNKTKEVFKELQEIKTFQQFLSDQYEEMKKRLQESEGHAGEFQKQNADLSEKVQQLHHQTDQLTHQISLLEQYSSRDCHEFQGIEYKDGESTDNLVNQYAKQTGITISEQDISISHRSAPIDPSSNNKVPNVIAKFTSRKIRYAIYKNRSILH